MATAQGGPLGTADSHLRRRWLATASQQWAASIPIQTILPLLLTVVGMVFRIIPWLAAYPLHRDEALYGAWAQLIASRADPLLLTAWVDKPPLVLYALAASLRWLGASELVLRLPGMIASTLAIPVVYGLARRAYTRQTALLAALLIASCPFAILFAPTAFTDPCLTLWLAAATWAALARRPLWAGVTTGLAVASKQQGVLVAALVVALLALPASDIGDGKRSSVPNPRHRVKTLGKHALLALAGFAIVFGPVMYWDSLRWASRPSFWDRGLATYGGINLARPPTWANRWADWGKQLGYLFGTPAISMIMLLLAAFAGASGIWRTGLARDGRGSLGIAGRPALVDAVLGLYVAAYLALHFFLTFQAWDRYLLPVLPLICVLAARGLALIWRWMPRGRWRTTGQIAVVLTGCVLLVQTTRLGIIGALPVGSDHGAYGGIDRVVATLRNQPSEAVIYHRWLGWHYDFYLFDAPQERRWWGSSWKLADDAARTAILEPQRTQWIVLPEWKDAAANEIRTALASRRLVLLERQRIHRPDGTRSFTVYEIAGAEKG